MCDLAVATPETRFGYPEVQRGLVAAMVMPHLLRHVGERTARYLLLTGELMDAEEACRVGFINVLSAGGATAAACIGLKRKIRWRKEDRTLWRGQERELPDGFSRQAASRSKRRPRLVPPRA